MGKRWRIRILLFLAVLGPGGNIPGRHPAAHAVPLQSRHDRVGGHLVRGGVAEEDVVTHQIDP